MGGLQQPLFTYLFSFLNPAFPLNMSSIFVEVPNPLPHSFWAKGSGSWEPQFLPYAAWVHGQFELYSLKPLCFIVCLLFLLSFSFLTTIWYFPAKLRLRQLESIAHPGKLCCYKLMEVCLPSSLYCFTCSRWALSLTTLSCLSKLFFSLLKAPSQLLSLLFSDKFLGRIICIHCLHFLLPRIPQPAPVWFLAPLPHENSLCFTLVSAQETFLLSSFFSAICLLSGTSSSLMFGAMKLP